MRGDVTRQTFRSREHYRSVLQQQGRVALDADWNEQAEIQAYHDRTVAADLIGVSGAPRTAPGMAIVEKDGKEPKDVAADDLRISKGHYYVDGILCENDDAVPLAAQPDLPDVALPTGDEDAAYVAYLDVWFEHVTRLEDTSLQEVALGGPDSTTRARTIWQVRLRPTDGDHADSKPVNPKAFMRAEAVDPGAAATTPCIVGPTARYRRLENQLYRIEVFDPSGTEGGPSFLWSRENGSVVAAVTDIKIVPPVVPPVVPQQDAEPQQGAGTQLDTVLLTIAEQGRDDRLAFHAKDWVEVTDRGHTRRGEHGVLAQLDAADGTTLTFRVPHVEEPEKQPVQTMTRPVVRRWDSDGPQPLPTGEKAGEEKLIALEDGVHVAFQAGSVYRTGDYWVVPARTAAVASVPGVSDLIGNVEWPRNEKQEPQFQPPAGVVHHYADIATLTRAGGKWTVVADLRKIFDPLTDPSDVDVTAAGGDGQECLPGVPLDEPLRVAVTRNLKPLHGETVLFTATGNGMLAPTKAGLDGNVPAPAVEVPTDEHGVAECFWKLAGDPPSQLVTAQLLDPDAPAGSTPRPTGPVLGFAASLSRADRVAFDPQQCVALDGASTVQAAVRRLAEIPVLVPVEGNGQVGPPDTDLTRPVTVLVRRCGGPEPNATVRFTVTGGTVTVIGPDGKPPQAAGATGARVTGETGADGTVSCRWQLGGGGPLQALTATLLDGAGPNALPDPRTLPLTFLAGVVPNVLSVDHVELGGTGLVEGAFVTSADLKRGAAAVLDAEPEPVVADGPALSVTLDLPFPISEPDRGFWSPATLLGTLPLGLAGTVATITVGEPPVPAVSWTPSERATTFLDALFTKLSALDPAPNRVRGHVRLAGSVLGAGASDDVRWFWLVDKATDLVLVPHREGLLQGWARRAIARSLPRDQLRDQLPAGVAVADEPLDLEGAEAAAKRIFSDTTPVRPLRLVVDAAYAAVGIAVKAAVEALPVEDTRLPQGHVEVELVDGGADLAQTVRDQISDNQNVDGVLTDTASASAIEDVDRFAKAVRL